MRYTIAAAAAAMAAGASAQGFNGTAAAGTGVAGAGNGANGGYQATAYATYVVDAYVTTCPGNVPQTTFTYNGQAYTGTAGQAITVTNCPCTVTAPAGSIPEGAKTATAPAVPANTGATSGSGATPGSGATSGSGSSAPGSNSNIVTPGSNGGAQLPGNGTSSGAGSSSTPEAYTGAASKLSGAGLAAVFAIAAYAL